MPSQIPLDQLEDPRIAELQGELAAAKDQMLRALAEMDNVRRRAEKSAEDARLFAIDRFGKDLLQVADTLARAVALAPDDGDERVVTFVDGVKLTERTLIETFARHGLKRIGAKGDKFDPNLHQAVSQSASDVPAGHVAEVLQAGFTLNDRTVRAAMVIVSGGGQSAASPPEGVDITV
jgi:molecular chaperone GrpE